MERELRKIQGNNRMSGLLFEPVDKKTALMTAPLSLAFIGDSVHDIFVRERLVRQHDYPPHGLHSVASGFVCAKMQAAAAAALMDEFDEDETAVFRRARNSKAASPPKNADIGDYHMATGLEAVLGYLYISAQHERLHALLERIWEISFALRGGDDWRRPRQSMYNKSV